MLSCQRRCAPACWGLPHTDLTQVSWMRTNIIPQPIHDAVSVRDMGEVRQSHFTFTSPCRQIIPWELSKLAIQRCLSFLFSEPHPIKKSSEKLSVIATLFSELSEQSSGTLANPGQFIILSERCKDIQAMSSFPCKGKNKWQTQCVFAWDGSISWWQG